MKVRAFSITPPLIRASTLIQVHMRYFYRSDSMSDIKASMFRWSVYIKVPRDDLCYKHALDILTLTSLVRFEIEVEPCRLLRGTDVVSVANVSCKIIQMLFFFSNGTKISFVWNDRSRSIQTLLEVLNSNRKNERFNALRNALRLSKLFVGIEE